MRLPSVLPRIARGRALPWALVAVLLVAAVGSFVLWRSERAQEARREEVAATAHAFLEALTTFEADTIEDDVDDIRRLATGAFSREVEETFSRARIEDIRDAEVRSEGVVRDLYVQGIEDVRAEVFAVVEETVRNAATPAGRTDVLRIAVELIETANGWRVSGVEVLRSPGAPPLP